MNEVEARLHQVDVREAGTAQRLSAMAAQAMKLDALAAQASLKRLEAMQKGSSYSRAADDVRAQRTAMQGGDSDRIRRAEALKAQRESLDIAPLIRQARAADAELSKSVKRQQEARAMLAMTTASGVEEDIKLTEKELKDATKAYTTAAANFRKANADLEAHAAKASGLGKAENVERAKAAKEIQNLSKQEDELRRKHQAYLDSLAGRASTLKGASQGIIARMPHIQAMDEARSAVEEARAANMAQDAFEHRVRAANAIAAASEKIGLGTIAALGGATKVGADFDQMMLREQHNTTLTAAGIDQMSTSIKRLGAESGAPLDELAKGFRRASDLGFNATQSTEILTAAMKASVATGSDLGETTALLSKAMKEYNIPAKYAAQTMGLLVETSRRSALSMGELVSVSGRVNAIAANMGLSFLEVQAAMVVYTRHGLDAAQASTQLRNDIAKIITPSKQVQTALGNLAKASKDAGVNLVRDFSSTGLRAKGLLGIWEDIEKVAAKYKGGVNPVDLAVKLFPNQRGTLGAAIATGTGFVEYGKQMEDLRQKARDGVSINTEYQDSLKQINQQFARMKNSLTIASSAFSTAFAPTIKTVADQILNLTRQFNELPQPMKTSIANSIALGGAFLVAAGLAGKLAVGIASLNNMLMVNTGIGLAGSIAGFLPPVAVIVGITAAFAGLMYLVNKYNNMEADAAQHLHEEIDARVIATRAADTHARRIYDLSQQYEALKVAFDVTGQGGQQLQAIMDEIGRLSPALVTGWDNQGHALGLVANQADIAAQSMRNLAREATLAASAQIGVRAQERAQKRSELQEQRDEINKALQEGGRHITRSFGGGYPGAGVYSNARRLESFSVQEVQSEVAKRDALNAQMSEIDKQNAADMALMRDTLRTGPGARPGSQPPAKKNKDLYDPFGANKYPQAPGVDPTAGLYDKDKKGKSKKQSDAEKLDDSYFERMKSLAQGRFLAENQGKEGDALWETQAHGYVRVGNEVRKVTGDFYGLSASMKSAFIQSSQLSDRLELQKKISEDLASAMKNANRDQWLAQGKRTDSEKDEYDYQHETGAYAIDQNETNPARLAMLREANRTKRGMNADTIRIQESVQAKKDIEDIKKEVGKPLEAGVDPWWQNYTEMLGKIREAKLAYIKIGEDGAEKLAMEYANNIKNVDITKTYTQALADANKELAKYTEKDDDVNKVTYEQTQTLELAKEQYKDLTAEQKKHIIEIYKNVDASARKLALDKEAAAALKEVQKQMHAATSSLQMTRDPKEGRWQEYIDKIKEQSPETFKDPTSAMKATNKASIDFNKLESIREETEARQGVADIMEQVKQKSKQLSAQYKMEVGDIKITRQQWDLLTDAEKKNIKELDKMEKIKDVMHQVMGGLHDIISSTLDDIHQHGFKNFFQDVLKGFDDLIWQIGKKWAMAQLDKLITGALGGIGGGGGNSNPWSEAINVVGGIGSGIAGAAIGAPMSAGETRVVGERGPELFTAGRSGAVLNTRESRGMMSGGYGGSGTVVNMTVNTPDARGIVNSAHQITQDIGRKMNAVRRRG